MILGSRCTRRCSFCAVNTARPEKVDWDEPQRLAEAVEHLGLSYVVVTSVARDDLRDEGSSLFAASIQAIKKRTPQVKVEVLTPDFHARPDLIGVVVAAGPDVYSHNVETVERLTRSVRPQADYQRSLDLLRIVHQEGTGKIRTKSGLMVGLGETSEEVRHTMLHLREVGCDFLTIGQYLQPTVAHQKVGEFISPEQFEIYRRWGEELGFSFVASAPFVRSSYNAYEALERI